MTTDFDSGRFSRRQLLARSGCGFGMLALADALRAEDDRATRPFAVREPHYTPRAKRVIFLYMPGGPSHVDMFDPKPQLELDAGKPLPFEKPKLERVQTGNLLPSPWKFAKHGQSGTDVSELLPHIASCVDDLCVIRSMHADNINHTGAALQMCTGEQAFSRPSLGSWLTYGLGTEKPEPAVIRRRQPGRRVPGSAIVGIEFSAQRVPGHAGARSQSSHRESR